MELARYIELIGVRDFARKFGVTERAALAYRQLDRRPRPAKAREIVADSPVTWEGIYKPEKKKRNAVPSAPPRRTERGP